MRTEWRCNAGERALLTGNAERVDHPTGAVCGTSGGENNSGRDPSAAGLRRVGQRICQRLHMLPHCQCHCGPLTVATGTLHHWRHATSSYVRGGPNRSGRVGPAQHRDRWLHTPRSIADHGPPRNHAPMHRGRMTQTFVRLVFRWNARFDFESQVVACPAGRNEGWEKPRPMVARRRREYCQVDVGKLLAARVSL